ncbi:MAG TPA: signal peptide peptidase SppA [Candidatus Eisenbacteria bacterium]
MSTRRGIVAFLVLLTGLGGIVLLAAIRLRGPVSAEHTVITFDVPSELEESEAPAQGFSLRRFRRETTTLYDLVTGLRAAAEDEHVDAIVLHVDDVRWGWAKLGEVRRALQAFPRAGKRVYASLGPGAGEAEYLLASAAGVVGMPPTATLGLNGLSLSVMFMKGTFDKIGVTPDFDHIGAYKSAVEGYTRTGMSVPAREALQAVLDDHYRLLVDSLATARHMTRPAVARALDDGPYTGRLARARGLVDTLIYDADLDSLALARAGRHAQAMSLSRYLDRVPESRAGRHIALVVAEGTIVPGRSRQGPGEGREVGAETLIESLREARRRGAIRAIVLRIDSPGGSAQASDDIWREVDRCRRSKPVIVSMSDYAASGGYYIAAPADSIVADPATLTGSIGIFGGKFNVRGLLSKLGLSVETISRGDHADMFSPFSNFSPEEARRFHAMLEDGYRNFLDRVARGRRRSTAQVEAVAGGRVWTGLAARSRGLVDRLGGIEEAIAMARARAGIGRDEEIVVERFPKVKRSFLQGLIEDLVDEQDAARDGEIRLPPVLQAYLAAARLPAGQALALMPYSIEVR